MDLRGVEPLSESPSIAASPITVIILTFPQIFGNEVPHLFEAGDLSSE